MAPKKPMSSKSKPVPSPGKGVPGAGRRKIGVEEIARAQVDPCLYSYMYPIPAGAIAEMKRLLHTQNERALPMIEREAYDIKNKMCVVENGVRVMTTKRIEAIQAKYPTAMRWTTAKATGEVTVPGVNLVIGACSVNRGCNHLSCRGDKHLFCPYCNKARGQGSCVRLGDVCAYGRRHLPHLKRMIYDKYEKHAANGTQVWECRYVTSPAEVVTQEHMDVHAERLVKPAYKLWWKTDGPRFPVVGRRGTVSELVAYVWQSLRLAALSASDYETEIDSWVDRGYSRLNQRYRAELVLHSNVLLQDAYDIGYLKEPLKKRNWMRRVLAQYFFFTGPLHSPNWLARRGRYHRGYRLETRHGWMQSRKMTRH